MLPIQVTGMVPSIDLPDGSDATNIHDLNDVAGHLYMSYGGNFPAVNVGTSAGPVILAPACAIKARPFPPTEGLQVTDRVIKHQRSGVNSSPIWEGSS